MTRSLRSGEVMLRGTRLNVSVAPLEGRLTTTEIGDPSWGMINGARPYSPWTEEYGVCPFTKVMMSPGSMPASAAGVPVNTWVTYNWTVGMIGDVTRPRVGIGPLSNNSATAGCSWSAGK